MSNAAPPAAPVASTSEGEQLIGALVQVMDQLLAIVDEETKLVRAGKLRDASLLAQRKGELSQLYILAVNRLKANQPYLEQALPEMIEALKKRHDLFRALLQINLTVLATAHAVSEGIVRGVSGELARKASPSTYGATGRANAPSPRVAQPLAVSRSL